MNINEIDFCGLTKEEFINLPDNAVIGYINEYPFSEDGLKYKGRKSGYTTKAELMKMIELNEV